MLRFRSIDLNDRSIVFYAEDAGSWRYFEPIIEELLTSHVKRICYVTSSPSDPILLRNDNRILTFSIGSGLARTIWFLYLNTNVLVMTMPDLGTYHIKRSRNSVHYAYVYHSIVSTHMAYHINAFDHFDSIFCVGPHHFQEIRETEQLYGLKPKKLIKAGYGIVDSILASRESDGDNMNQSNRAIQRVLIAPSWGENSLLESVGSALIQVILEAGYQLTVRPHTMTIRRSPKLLNELQKQFSSNSGFILDTDLLSQGTVHSYDIMVSDWSGAALEYAFGLERPVLFVDVRKKINNPDYGKISHVPIEVQLRSKLGKVVSLDQLSEIPFLLAQISANSEMWRKNIVELRSHWIYNVGNSEKVTAAHIAEASVSPTAPETGGDYL